MKRYGMLPWLLVGAILVMAAAAIAQSIELTWTSMVGRSSEFHRHWHGPDGPVVVVRSSPAVHLAIDWVPFLLKLGVFALGAALWLKAAGLLRWAGGALAALVLCSQFPILLGLALIGLAVWIVSRTRRTASLPAAPSPIMARRPAMNADHGAWLDEWEKRQQQEQTREEDEHGRIR